MEPEWIAAWLLLGAVVGFFAGLFGIGGGGIMVPLLTTLFILQGLPAGLVVHMALGTSMAAIILTSLSSLRAHHSHRAVLWPIVWRITPGILAGTFGAAFITTWISSRALAIFFAIFMAWVSVRMMTDKKPVSSSSREMFKTAGLILAGLIIGVISALVAIGGGSLTVPFLTGRGVKIQNAIGTSAAVGFPISVAGAAGYLSSGFGVQGLPPGSFGYIYLPAALLISIVSFLVAPAGAKLAHKLPVKIMKRLFAIFLMLLSLKMLHTVFTVQ